MTLLLLGVALGSSGIVAGIYVTGLIHDHRASDLSAGQYTAVHQMRDKTFRRVMPVLGLANLGLVAASAVLVVGAGLPRLLAASAVLLLVADIVFTVTRQLPLNQQIESWKETAIPADWPVIRDRWAAHHRVRVALGMTAHAAFLAAVLLTLAH